MSLLNVDTSAHQCTEEEHCLTQTSMAQKHEVEEPTAQLGANNKEVEGATVLCRFMAAARHPLWFSFERRHPLKR